MHLTMLAVAGMAALSLATTATAQDEATNREVLRALNELRHEVSILKEQNRHLNGELDVLKKTNKATVEVSTAVPLEEIFEQRQLIDRQASRIDDLDARNVSLQQSVDAVINQPQSADAPAIYEYAESTSACGTLFGSVDYLYLTASGPDMNTRTGSTCTSILTSSVTTTSMTIPRRCVLIAAISASTAGLSTLAIRTEQSADHSETFKVTGRERLRCPVSPGGKTAVLVLLRQGCSHSALFFLGFAKLCIFESLR